MSKYFLNFKSFNEKFDPNDPFGEEIDFSKIDPIDDWNEDDRIRENDIINIDKEDVINLINSLNEIRYFPDDVKENLIELSEEEIEEVLARYPHEQLINHEVEWYLVVEDIIYQIINEKIIKNDNF